MLLSFTASLWYFNQGDVFTSVPLVYPPLVYLLLRGALGGAQRPRRRQPPGLARLAAGGGDRVPARLPDRPQRAGLERDRRRLRGRDRRRPDRARAGALRQFPVEDDLKACGPADSAGEIRERIQTNGRCESANPLGDTYGPVAYAAYLPGYWALGWTGKWDDLPGRALHVRSRSTSLCVLGLALVGPALRRRPAGGDTRLRLGCLPVHPVRVELEHERRDHAGVPDLRLLARDVAVRRAGSSLALAGWTKFAALIARAALARPIRSRRRPRRVGALRRRLRAREPRGASRCSCSSPSLLHAARVFWDRTICDQVDAALAVLALGLGAVPRRAASPISRSSSRCSQGLLVAGAIAAAFLPAPQVAAPARCAHGRRSCSASSSC